MRFLAAVVALCALTGCAASALRSSAPRFILLSQHMASDGAMWWRQEGKPLPKDECRAVLRRITTRPKVRMTAWLDVSPQQLEKEFGAAATPDKGTWLACWPEGTALDEPDS